MGGLRRGGPGFEERRHEGPAAGSGRRADGRQATGTGAAAGPRRGASGGLATAPPAAAPSAAGQEGPQRGQRVVGDLAGPHEVPQRGEELGVRSTRRRAAELVPERGAVTAEVLPDRRVHQPVRAFLLGRTTGSSGSPDHDGELVAEAEAQPAVGGSEGTGADPHDVAARAQVVEIAAAIAEHASRQHVPFERGSDERCSLEQAERLDESIEAAPVGGDAMPGGQESCQGLLLDGLDLAAQRGQRSPAELAQHLHVAPLALQPVRAELAPHQALLRLEGGQGAEHPLRSELEAASGGLGQERTMGAGVPADELLERAGDRIGEGDRQPDRDRRIRARPGSGPRPRPRSPAPRLRSAPRWPGARPPAPPSTRPPCRCPRCAGPARPGTGRPAGAGRRAARRRCGPGARRSGTAARAPGRRGPRGRAARGAPPRPAARAAGPDRAPAPPPAARPAVRPPRTCTRRSS